MYAWGRFYDNRVQSIANIGICLGNRFLVIGGCDNFGSFFYINSYICIQININICVFNKNISNIIYILYINNIQKVSKKIDNKYITPCL